MGVAVLRITSPTGHVIVRDLDHGPLTIGRAAPDHDPDIALHPDPQRWVSRVHCSLESADGLWSVTDCGSVNGTLLRHGEGSELLTSRLRVHHGDALLIVGDMDESGSPQYWELTFLDPHSTQEAPFGPPTQAPAPGPSLRYDWVAAQAYRCSGSTRTPVTGLRPQGHQLVRYMVGRGRDGETVACSHAELIAALWGDADEWPEHRSYTRNDLAGVVRAVRLCVEENPAEPRVLQTITGFGYRLVVEP